MLFGGLHGQLFGGDDDPVSLPDDLRRVLHLQGVIFDGSAPMFRSRQDIIISHADVILDIEVVRANGIPFDVSSSTIVMYIVRKVGESPVYTKAFSLRSDLGVGRAIAVVTATELASFNGKLLYDVFMSRSGTSAQIVPLSNLVLRD